MNTAASVNTPYDIVVGGVTYTISMLEMADWGKVQAWIVANVPGPLEALKGVSLDGMSPATERSLLILAIKEQQKWPPRPGYPDWFDALNRTGKDGREGTTVFLQHAIGKHRPGFSYEDAVALNAACDEGTSTRIINLAFGQEFSDPKASSGGSPGADPTPPTPSPTTSPPPTGT